MKFFVAILFCFIFALRAQGQTCSVSVTTTPRSGGSFQSGSGVSQIYDVIVDNSGSCFVNNIILDVTLPANSSITSSWNLQADTGSLYTVTSYGAALPSGNSVNTGFVVNFPNTQTVPSGVSAAASTTTCNTCASSSTAATTGTASTTAASTTAASTTAATTSGSVTSTSSTSGTNSACAATSTITPRAGSSFQSGSGVSQIYDVVVTNSGSCPLNNIVLSITLPAGSSITSSWNIQASTGSLYTVTSYGAALPSGNSVNAGFIVNFPNTQTVPSGVSAPISTTTCNVCASSSSSSTAATTSTASTTAASTTAATTSGSVTSTSSTTGTNSACAATSVITPRSGGSYQSGTGVSQIYDVVVTNSGSCPLNNIILSITLPAGASISSSWNIQAGTGSLYTVTSYGAALPVGNSVNVGFIVLFPNTQTVPSGVSAPISTTTCNVCSSSSSSSTAATTGTASTTAASTSAASTTAATTSGSVTSTSSTSGTNSACAATSTITPRASSSFQSGTGVSQIYDISVTNSGSCTLNNIVLSVALPSGSSITSSWNLQAGTGSLYTLTSYGGALPAGSSATAGFIVNFPGTQTVPSGVSAPISTSTCNTCS